MFWLHTIVGRNICEWLDLVIIVLKIPSLCKENKTAWSVKGEKFGNFPVSVLVKGVWLMYMNAGGLFVGLPQTFFGEGYLCTECSIVANFINSSWFICAWVCSHCHHHLEY